MNTTDINDDELRIAFEHYVGQLSSQELPIIFDHAHLSSLVGIDNAIMSVIAHNPSRYYREFKIPKRRNNEYRIISTPYQALMHIQRWINNEILNKIEISPHAHGFIKGRSIISNAQAHLGQTHLLKMDMKNFFPSIGINRVIDVFQRCGYMHSISYELANYCCLNQHLPQGGAASPSLSNIICRRLDKRISNLASKYELIYTRYADDLIFSGKYISSNFIVIVSDIIGSEGFATNNRKTKLVRNHGKKIVTGISVSSNKLTLPKSTKRELRKEVYYFTKHGYFESTISKGVFDPIYTERLIGKMLFWKQIEPENSFVINQLSLLREIQIELNTV